MNIAIRQIGLTPEQPCELDIPEPGIIRHVAIGGEPKRVAGLDGKTHVQELVILFAEVDPEAPTRRRTFIVFGPGGGFAPKEGVRAIWCGIGLSLHTGVVAYVYELVLEDAEN